MIELKEVRIGPTNNQAGVSAALTELMNAINMLIRFLKQPTVSLTEIDGGGA